jgi:osmotically-inducible protein OsmY
MKCEQAIVGIGLLSVMGLPMSVEASDSKSMTLKQIGRYSAGASTVPGGRSFFIRRANGSLVYDHGDEFEQRTAALVPDLFNSQGDIATFDTRRDNKGPEPEAVAIGKVSGRAYAFIGLEPIGGVMVYDISKPTEPKFTTYTAPTDRAPKGLLFIKKHALGTAGETTPVTDTWLTAKTKIALFANARIKGREIIVEASRGAVIIRGEVDSDKARQTAEGIAKEIPGVTSVKNHLQVMAPSRREVIDDKDEAITTRVAEQIAKDSQLKPAGILVQTFAGVVSLSGEISDIVTSAHASWAAWQVPGVKLVKNELRVKEKA